MNAALFLNAALLAVGLAAPGGPAADARTPYGHVEPGPTATATLTPPLASFQAVLQPEPWPTEKAEDRVNPLAGEPDQGRRGTWNRKAVPADPLAAASRAPGRETPLPLFDFAGTGNPTGCGGCSPPDTVGDVGPNHYVQVVNATKVAIFDKTGVQVAGPFDLSAFWSSGNCTGDLGDPVVVYDWQADRWLLAQFAIPQDFCFAVSQTADPTGSYFVYDFPATDFPDYFKIGVWSDAFYVAANENPYSAWAFERSKMLLGQTAQSLKAAVAGDNFFMPVDLNGHTPPPDGTPGYFYTFLDDSFHGGVDRIQLGSFHVDWTTPGNSTWSSTDLPIASFTYTVCGFFNFSCAPQAGTSQRVDVVSEWPMYRFTYRRFGDHESLLGNFTVATGSPVYAAPRWFELRRVGNSAWSLYQEGTYSPSTGVYRFMGSIAQDGSGDIALGFTASNASIHPQIRYATRLPGDPLGTLGSEETLTSVVVNGSQTGSNRWGDYSAMSVDPADDCTFWYTNEYYPTNGSSNWQTRVGTFRVPECGTIFVDGFESGDSSRWSATQP
jgi:hypothetical protein